MKKQQDKNNPPEEWELALTLEPEEEEQPDPGDGSALTDEDILLLGYLGGTLVAGLVLVWAGARLAAMLRPAY